MTTLTPGKASPVMASVTTPLTVTCWGSTVAEFPPTDPATIRSVVNYSTRIIVKFRHKKILYFFQREKIEKEFFFIIY